VAQKTEKVVKRRVPREVKQALEVLRKQYRVVPIKDLEKEAAALERKKTTMEAQKDTIREEAQKKKDAIDAELEKVEERITEINNKIEAANEHQQKFDELVKHITDDEEEK
jgi:hypothetical protein